MQPADSSALDVTLAHALADALASGDDSALRKLLIGGSGLPGPRMNLRLVWSFAREVGRVVQQLDPPVAALEALLDGWATQPEEVLACAAVASYGEVGAVRPGWWEDEVAKLRRAANDERWRVREVVAQALQRLLEADWDRTVARLLEWAADTEPFVVRAAAAGVAEPRVLKAPGRAADAMAVQRVAVDSYRRRRNAVLKKALGFTISVAAAPTGDLDLIEELARTGDPDLIWVARENLLKSRLRRWRPPAD